VSQILPHQNMSVINFTHHILICLSIIKAMNRLTLVYGITTFVDDEFHNAWQVALIMMVNFLRCIRAISRYMMMNITMHEMQLYSWCSQKPGWRLGCANSLITKHALWKLSPTKQEFPYNSIYSLVNIDFINSMKKQHFVHILNLKTVVSLKLQWSVTKMVEFRDKTERRGNWLCYPSSLPIHIWQRVWILQ